MGCRATRDEQPAFGVVSRSRRPMPVFHNNAVNGLHRLRAALRRLRRARDNPCPYFTTTQQTNSIGCGPRCGDSGGLATTHARISQQRNKRIPSDAGRAAAAPAGRGCRRPTGKSDRGTKSSTYNGALLSITNTNSVIVTFTLLVRSQIASMPVIFDHNNHCFPLSISRTRFPPNWSSHFSRFLMVEHFWFQNSKF